MTDKACTTCCWWTPLNDTGKCICLHPVVDCVMTDGTCPEWEEIAEDTDVLAGQYVPNGWDEWKRKAMK